MKTLEETKNELIKEYKVLWTKWKLVKNFKMKKSYDNNAKLLLESLIEKSYKEGFKSGEESQRVSNDMENCKVS